jgi:hypothetical protein
MEVPRAKPVGLHLPAWNWVFGKQPPSPALTSVAGKSAGCPVFLPVGRGGEGGNGLPKWSQSRPCNDSYISRKPDVPVPS